MPDFNEDTQRAKVAAGFKGGPMFNNPNLAPSVEFVEGHPGEETTGKGLKLNDSEGKVMDTSPNS